MNAKPRLYAARHVSCGDVRLSAPVLRLPRLIESDPRAPQVLHMLTAHTRLLWKEGEIEVTVATLSSELETALRAPIMPARWSGLGERGAQACP